MHPIGTNPTLDQTIDQYLLYGDDLSIKIILALDLKKPTEIERIAKDLISRNPHSKATISKVRIDLNNWHFENSSTLISSVIEELFRQKNPLKTQEKLALFFENGGSLGDITDFLETDTLPTHEEDKAIFFETIRRAKQIAEEMDISGKNFLRKLFEKKLLSNEPVKILHQACKHGFKNLVGIILRLGIEINSRYPSSGATPLYTATWLENIPLMTDLLNRGADVNITTSTFDNPDQNKEGNESPLHAAAARGNLQAVKLLLSWGANPGAISAIGFTPYKYAENNQHKAVAEFLKEYVVKGK